MNLSYLKGSLFRIFSVVFVASFVVGCSSVPQQNFQPVTVQSSAQAQAWELQGKIAVRSADDKFSTNLYWFHQPHGDDLRLTTFIGTNLMTLKSDANGATLIADGNTYQDSSAQSLLDNMLQIQIPLDSLPLWITGQANQQDSIISYNADGTIKQLHSADSQLPWQVTFISWQQQGGAKIPRLIQVVRADVQIRIQTNQWQAMQALAN